MKEIIKADSLHRLNQQVTEFVENHLSMADEITIVTTIKNWEYVSKVIPKDAASALKEELVKEHRYVDFFVSRKQVGLIAIDEQRDLTPEQMDSVMDSLSKNGMDIGLSDHVIRNAISEACADATDQDWDEDDSGIEYLRSIGKR